MKKTVSAVMIVVSLFCMVFVTGCGTKADYEYPQDLYAAHAGGTNVIGKTVRVQANRDYTMGLIFSAPTPNLGPTMHIDVTGTGADRVKDNDELIVKITDIRESKFMIVFTGTIVRDR